MNDAALDVYLLSAAALFFNLVFLVVMIGATRSKAKAFVNPEDAAAFKGKPVEQEDPKVTRLLAAHRNALENIPIFLILAYLHVVTGASKASAMAYFITFVASRWLHSLVYIRGLQPWRTLSYTVGLLAMVGIAVRLVIVALS